MAHPAIDRSSAVMATMSDADLVTDAAAGVSVAFDELYRRHSQTAWRVAQAVTRNSHDAADAVSEAFVKVIQAVAAGRLDEGSNFRSYLLTSTRHCAIDTLRRTGRTEPTADDDVLDLSGTLPTPPERLEGGADAVFVAAAFNDLPERWRSVLWLTEVEGIPPREAASQLGLSANGTAQLAVRARAGLRERYLQAHLRSEVPEGCRFTVERLGAYVAGALSTRDLAKVDQHLAGCDECRTRKEELEDLGRSLRLALIPIPLLLGGLAAGKWSAAFVPASSVGGTLGWVTKNDWAQKALAGAAAAVFAAGALGAFVVQGRDDRPVRELATPAVDESDEAPAEEAPPPPAFDAVEVSPDAVAELVRGTAPPPPGDAGGADDDADPPDPPAARPPDDDQSAPPADNGSDDGDGDGDGDGGGGEDPAEGPTEVAVGGRMGDSTLEVQVQADAEGCSGVTAGDTSAGCEPEAAPEDDGLSVRVGGGVLPQVGTTLP
jgi:RNA polymerase sigma factor (sigma-70 family)